MQKKSHVKKTCANRNERITETDPLYLVDTHYKQYSIDISTTKSRPLDKYINCKEKLIT